MRAIYIRLFRYFIGERTGTGGWLDRINIQAGAQAACLQRLNQRGLVHYLAARGVNEVRAFAHRIEKVSVDQEPGFGIESKMDANDVGGTGDCQRRGFVFNTQSGSSVLSQTATPGDDRHATSAGAWNHLLPDPAETNQAQRAAVQTTRLGKLLFIPLATPQSDHVIGNAAVERKDQRKCQFGDTDGDFAGTVRNIDA